MRNKERPRISGLILTGGLIPDKTIFHLIKETDIPVLLSEEDTYTVTSKLHSFIVRIKIGDADTEKINVAMGLVDKYVDVDRMWDKIS
jgi:BioD-like phosphotransacetylase family protein